MSPRRIAVLETIAFVGGAEISLLELIRKLGGDPQFVVILPEDGPLREKLMDAGAEVRILPWPARLMNAGERARGLSPSALWDAALAAAALPGLARRLAQLLDEIGADVLVTNGIKSHILGALTHSGSHRPLIWYLRDGLEGRTMSTLAMRMLGRRCRCAIAISRYVESEARKVLPRSAPVSVIYNLVDFGRFHPATRPPVDIKKPNGEIWFGAVGSLTPLKGQDIFLKAAARVARQLPQARFALIGSNFYKSEAASTYERHLRDIAAQPGLAGRVFFLGQRDDIASVLALLDVLVQSNREPEALGRSVLEAMACGVPVIAVNRWGPAELIVNGQTGVLTPVLDVQALAENMVALGQDAERRAALSAAAMRWVRDRLEPDRITEQFRGVVDNLEFCSR